MLILAFESSAQTASAALWRDGALLAEYSVNAKNTHSVTLLPMAERMLAACGLSVSAVDAFACSAGPGSFTGIRIGVATVKGLAFGSDKPCVGVSSVEALAYGLRFADGIVCPLIGARRSQYYSALFRVRAGAVERLTPDGIVLSAEIASMLAGYSEPIRFCGDGYADVTASLTHPCFVPTPPRLRLPSAFAVAECAAERLLGEADPSAFSAAELAPVYLRPTQAEREREERLSRAQTEN